MMRLVVLLSSFLIITTCFSQSHKPDIQYLALKDSFLVNQIKRLITIEGLKDTLWSSGYGTISLGFNGLTREGVFNKNMRSRIDTIMTYNIYVSYFPSSKERNKLGDVYPNYYSLIDDRPILIFDGGKYGSEFGFSDNSKKIFNQIVSPFQCWECNRTDSKKKLIIHYLEDRFLNPNMEPVLIWTDSIDSR